MVDRHPALLDPRLELATQLIDRGDFEQGGLLLDQAPDPDNPEVVQLRVRLLRLTGREEEALKLLDRLIGQQPHHMQLAIDKAKLQLSLATPEAAEQTLLVALDHQPTAESVYRELIKLYESGRLRHATDGYRRLLRRLWSTIPHSRVARVERARVLAAQNKFDQAQPLLRKLLSEQPDDLARVGYPAVRPGPRRPCR